MTIDEYLDQLRRLKHDRDKAMSKLTEAEHKAVRTRSASDFSNVHTAARDFHAHEDLMIEYADAAKACRTSINLYNERRDQLADAIDYLLYWEGCIINQMYLYNLYLGNDLLKGVNEILRTDDRSEILAKISEAKMHLQTILQQRGVEIE